MSNKIYISPDQILKFDAEKKTLAYFDFYTNHWKKHSLLERENESASSDSHTYYQINEDFPNNLGVVVFNPESEDPKNSLYLLGVQGRKIPTLPYTTEFYQSDFQENINLKKMPVETFFTYTRQVRDIFDFERYSLFKLLQGRSFAGKPLQFFKSPIHDLIRFAEKEAKRLDHWYIWNGRKKAKEIRDQIKYDVNDSDPIHQKAENIYRSLATHRFTLFSDGKQTHSIEKLREKLPEINNSLSNEI